MDPLLLAGLALAGVFALLVLRVPIAYCLGSVACLGLLTFFSWRPGGDFDIERGLRPTLSIIGSTSFGFVHNYPLSMIPLFIALGHVAYQAGITTDLYRALRIALGRTPGGLAMASVMGCGGFSAITGSSVACAAAMGRIAVPEMLRYRYRPELACGSVAAGGTLGSLIPPSLLFVIYAIFTEQSVKSLFLAGVLPGLLSLAGFLLTVWLWVRFRPEDAPLPEVDDERPPLGPALLATWPTLVLLVVVVGGIYLGIFTPTEAAAVSLLLAVLIGFATGRLTLAGLADAGAVAIRQTAMIFAIALAAKIFVAFVSLTRITPAALDWVVSSGAPLVVILAGLVLFYLIIGMFLDSIGILVLTLPFTVPLVESYGLDLIWFGVVVVKLLEIGLITPPIGLNVFVIKSVAPPEVRLEQVFRGVAWFLLLDALVLLAILTIPALSLWLPGSAF
ncbi:MAG: TRAP transporter large permease [Kiloniellales bacterium]